jgi:hypothetical protein
MSKIALTPNASGTGTFTIAAPNSNTNRTLTLPDEAGTVLTNASNIEAQVKTATNATGSAPIYACRAWVNFNGTGTVAIRASGNVSSITDNGVGTYTVNFTTAVPDVNYTTLMSGSSDGNTDLMAVQTQLVGSVAVLFGEKGVANRDQTSAHVAVFR